ncbi:MAG TPA: YdeI/OmpD-associated family protein [Jiangellaceae bacterium]|nr:YdeI/OmpD-associated family protein [Jiangellaceae bacterium]
MTFGTRSGAGQSGAIGSRSRWSSARSFDSLAQFYTRAYLRWIDATKRRPEARAARIAEMVELLKAGHKERPRD